MLNIVKRLSTLNSNATIITYSASHIWVDMIALAAGDRVRANILWDLILLVKCLLLSQISHK